MSLAADLLEQAEHLAARDATRPKQANLRRAVSSAYYALFHLLIREASTRLVTGTELRDLISRAFEHGSMKKACAPFASGNLPSHLQAVITPPIPSDLRQVAETFAAAQEARHEADYNVGRDFTRTEVQRLIRQVIEAFEAWDRIRGHSTAQVFLAALFVGDRWKRG